VRRAGVALTAALACGLVGWGGPTLGGSSTVGAVAGVTVGSERVAPAAIEAAAARLARRRPRRLPAARRTAADRAIERLWLEGEAAERGLLRVDPDMPLLRRAVADALVGAPRRRDRRRFAHAFDAFHERWRSRTRCEAAYHDPYADRCGNRAGAAAGTCRWMGEATLCALSGDRRARWLVVRDAASARASRGGANGVRRVVRLRSRARAVELALAVYASARAARHTAWRRARRARAAAAAERAAAGEHEARARERESRLRDPRLSGPAIASARAACARQVEESDPYLFGFGIQDVVGGAEGLIAVRAALARRLAGAARNGFDRRKLRPLVRAIAAGNRELARLATADAAGDHRAAATLVARFDARTEPERAVARRLGLGDCLVRPARTTAARR
jgi:hypothetical protein